MFGSGQLSERSQRTQQEPMCIDTSAMVAGTLAPTSSPCLSRRALCCPSHSAVMEVPEYSHMVWNPLFQISSPSCRTMVKSSTECKTVLTSGVSRDLVKCRGGSEALQ